MPVLYEQSVCLFWQAAQVNSRADPAWNTDPKVKSLLSGTQNIALFAHRKKEGPPVHNMLCLHVRQMKRQSHDFKNTN